MDSTSICTLNDLGVLRFRGVDAARFLQGQLSNDVMQLATQRSLLAGFHNPQGRVLALLRLAQPDEDDILAVLPASLCETAAAALRRYVLRAKLTITDETSHACVYGYLGTPPTTTPASAAPIMLPCDGHPQHQDSPQPRGLLIDRHQQLAPGDAQMAPEQWHALDIAAGLPQIYPATAGEFVAQMLNLDCVDAISFRKGCYTGQEVIARAHYRGRVKRRMRRFISAHALTLTPGDNIQLMDGRSARVVDAHRTAAGRCEFLAVTTAAPDTPIAPPAPSIAQPDAPHSRVEASELPLPYSLPD